MVLAKTRLLMQTSSDIGNSGLWCKYQLILIINNIKNYESRIKLNIWASLHNTRYKDNT
jgi:hypothetical protein